MAASFLRLEQGGQLETSANSTSELFYVIHGKGTSTVGDRQIAWSQGDFFTPPGYWHEHRNESGERAYLTPIQDAGLHTYLRTLDITFYK